MIGRFGSKFRIICKRGLTKFREKFIEIHSKEKISAAELVYTKLHAGGKFNEEGGAYKVSGGLHGVGAAVVNALSKYVDLEIKKNGKLHSLKFERGNAVKPLEVIGELPDEFVAFELQDVETPHAADAAILVEAQRPAGEHFAGIGFDEQVLTVKVNPATRSA